MTSMTYSSSIRPAATEAAAATVAQASNRLHQALHMVWSVVRSAQAGSREAQRAARSAAHELLARRRDAQNVLAMARRYDASQPGFASDLRCAAFRAMDEA